MTKRFIFGRPSGKIGIEYTIIDNKTNREMLSQNEVLNKLNELYCEIYNLKKALNESHEENQRLKAQLYSDSEEGVCNICKHQHLVKHDMQRYYIAKCEKGHEECSKKSLRHCEDFEFKESVK